MKKLLATLAMGTAIVAATAPASAQSYRGDRYDRADGYDRADRYDRAGDYDRVGRYDRGGRGDTGFHPTQLRPRLDRISSQISQGMQRGRLTPREAARLRAEHRQVWQIATDHYMTNGINQRELRDIENRIDRLQQQVRFERRDQQVARWR